MSDKKVINFKSNDINNKRLTTEDISHALQAYQNMPFLSEEEKNEYKLLLQKRITLEDALHTFDLLLSPIMKADSEVRKHNDVLDVLLNDKLYLKEEDWKKAEDYVEEANREQREKLAQEFKKKNMELAKQNMKDADK